MQDEAWNWWDEMDRAPKPKRESWVHLGNRPDRIGMLICAAFLTLALASFVLQLQFFGAAAMLAGLAVVAWVWRWRS